MGRTLARVDISQTQYFQGVKEREKSGRYTYLKHSPIDMGSLQVQKTVNDQRRRADLVKARLQDREFQKLLSWQAGRSPHDKWAAYLQRYGERS